LLTSRVLVFRRDVITAEGWRDCVIGETVNQPLTCVRNGELHGIGFAIVVRHFRGSTAEIFDHRVVAEMKIISPLEVNDSCKRNDTCHARFMSGQAKRELSTR